MERTLLQHFYAAVRDDNIAAVNALMREHGCELKAHKLFSRSLLAAARNGSLPMIDCLLQHGIDINTKDRHGNVICEAVRENRLSIVPELVKRGAKLSVAGLIENPLRVAVSENSTEAVKLLLQLGIDPHKAYTLDGGSIRNMIELADTRELGEIVQLLQQAGCIMPDNSDKAIESRQTQHRERMLELVSQQLGRPTIEVFDRVRLSETEWDVDLCLAQPSRDFPFHTVFTLGMSIRWYQADEFIPPETFLEVMMHLPFFWDLETGGSGQLRWPLEWFRKVVDGLHEESIVLEQTFTMISNGDPPAPLGPGTKQSCLLLLPDFYDFSPLDLGNTKIVHFVHLVPLYTEERDFETANGMIPLLEEMSESPGALIVQPEREHFV